MFLKTLQKVQFTTESEGEIQLPFLDFLLIERKEKVARQEILTSLHQRF